MSDIRDIPELRYRPYERRYVPDLAAPMQAHRQHMLDTQTKEQADRLLEQRNREHQDDLRTRQASESRMLERDDRRFGLEERQLTNREGAASLENNRIDAAETERLMHMLFYGAPQEQMFAASQLEKHGLKPEGFEPAPDPAAVAVSPPPAPKAPMSPQDAALSTQLGAAEKRTMGALTGPTTPRFLPGQPAIPPPRVVESAQMLSPDDPYSKIVP